jgi:hypothetical protein
MKPFKFFNKPDKTFPEWMDRMDDHILGDLPSRENYVVIGVTPMMYNPHTFIPSKCIMYRNITTNETIKGEVIYEGHAYWNYNE